MHHHLRPASETDRAFLYALHSATMRALIEQVWGWDESWQRNNFDSRFQHCQVSVIELDGRAAGSLWLESRPDLLYIADLQVLPEFQGRGIGTAVVQEVIRQGARRGAVVALAVLSINLSARRLYERLGFAAIGVEGPFVHMQHDPNQGMM